MDSLKYIKVGLQLATIAFYLTLSTLSFSASTSKADHSFSVIETATSNKITFKSLSGESVKLLATYPELQSGKLNIQFSNYHFGFNANPQNLNNPDALYASLPLDDGSLITVYPAIKAELSELVANNSDVLVDNGEYIILSYAIVGDVNYVKTYVFEVYPDYYVTEEYENTGDLRIIPVADANADGIDDCKILYSDGEEQLLFVTYSVADSRGNICNNKVPKKIATVSDSFSVLETVSNRKMLFKLAKGNGAQLAVDYPSLLSGQLSVSPSSYRFAPNANLSAGSNLDALYASLPLPEGGNLSIYPEIKSELRLLANMNAVLEDNGEYIIQSNAISGDGNSVKANLLEIYPDYYLSDEYEDTGDLRLIAIADANADGIDDCKVLYSDGDEQLLFVTYNVADSRTNVCKDQVPIKKLKSATH